MPLKKDSLKDILFNTRAFNTLYINVEDERKVRQEQTDLLVDLLCNDRHKDARNEVFVLLKKEPKAMELLITAIGEAGAEDKRKLLIACWEADIDCTPNLEMFTDIVLKDDFSVAIEALTCIENMHGHITPSEADRLLNHIMESYPPRADESPKGHLISDLIELLRRWK